MLRQLPHPPSERTGWPWTKETDPDIYARRSDWPKISIITPSYNQGGYIEETIRSVLLQNYPNLEYLIIDGGSTDVTVEIIKKYSSWITYWVSEKDNGQSDAINKGLQKCSGAIFNWLNSDDFLEQDALYHIANSFIDNNIDIVAGKERRFGENITSFVHPGTTVLDSVESTAILGHNVQPSTFFRMDRVRENALNPSLHYLMDMDMYARYLLLHDKDKIEKVESVISNFRLHDDSKTVSQSAKFESDRWSIRWGMIRSLVRDEDRDLYLSFMEYYLLIPLPRYKLLESLDRNLLLNEYMRRLLQLHDKKGRTDLARKCFVYLWKNNGLSKGNKKSILVQYLKYHIVPPRFLMLFRTLKQGFTSDRHFCF